MPTLTRDHVLAAFTLAEMSGTKRPDVMSTSEGLVAAADAWVGMLRDMAPQTFAACVKLHLRHKDRGRFWPKIADIEQAREDIANANVPPAGRVFADLFWVRGSFGSWRKDAGVDYLVDVKGYPRGKLLAGIDALGGWDPIGMIPDPKLGGNAFVHDTNAKIFAAAYNAAPVTSTALTVAP